MLLAHDVGTTGDKASLHGDDGSLIEAVTVNYPTDYGGSGAVEQDPSAWWAAVCQATRRLLDSAGVRPEEVRAVCVSGQMMGAALLDDRYQPVRPAMIWADHRSVAQCRRLEDQVGMGRAYRITGHRLDPTYSLSKVMWVRDTEPEVFREVQHVCQAKDLVAWRLTGILATDPSDASSTNAYDQVNGCWSEELLGAAGIDPALFPAIVPSTTVLGGVTAQAAAATGLRAGTPVVMGGGDGPMAAVGAGVVAPGSGAYAYLGSSSWVSFASDEPFHDPGQRTMTFDHVVPGRYVPTATMQAGGGSVDWIAGVLEPAGEPGHVGTVLAPVGEVEASADELYFLPHLLGERSPYWNPAARGAFVGLARRHTREHLTRAVLEGVAFNLYTCLRAFGEAGYTFGHIDAIGGGAASDVWLQILADVWGVTIRRRAVAGEANSLGTAVTAGVAIGCLPGFEAAAGLSTVTAQFRPDAARHADYQRRHARFLAAYRALEPWLAAAGE